MNKEIERRGRNIYKELYIDKPSRFSIWWYGYDVWKYAHGIILGVVITYLLMAVFI